MKETARRTVGWWLVLAWTFAVPVAAKVETQVSLTYGREDAKADQPYAFDRDNNNAFATGGLGDGDVAGLGVQVLLWNKWAIGLEGQGAGLNDDDSVDTDPGASNDCNIRPLLGLVADCWDTGQFGVDTRIRRVDLTAGRRFEFKNSRILLTPFWGFRYNSIQQKMNVSFLYPGGFEDFIDDDLGFDGWGVEIGVSTKIYFGGSGAFFEASADAAKLFGNRDRDVVDNRYFNGNFLQQSTFSETVDLDPLAFEGSVWFGYRFRKIKTPIDLLLGYRYTRVQDFLDTRNTNDTAEFPMFTVGSQYKDYDTQALLFRFQISF